MSFARAVGLVRGEWVAIDGSKFEAVSGATPVAEREAAKRYLERLEAADQQEEMVIDEGAVAAAWKKLQADSEPEARFMHGPHAASAPAYNVQIAGDSEHALVVAHQVTTEANDKRSLLPRAEAKVALGNPAELHAVADAGYANAEQAEQCERQGIVSHVPVQRTVNN